jgi:hypothetical protein
MGYANRVITLQFPELTDDPADKIWVTIRNPKLVPPAEMRTDDVEMGPDGVTPVIDEKSTQASYGLFAKLVIGWHVYDASALPELDAEGNEVGGQVLLPMPATADLIGKLPMEIIARLGEELAKVNPQPIPASQEATGNPF